MRNKQAQSGAAQQQNAAAQQQAAGSGQRAAGSRQRAMVDQAGGQATAQKAEIVVG